MKISKQLALIALLVSMQQVIAMENDESDFTKQIQESRGKLKTPSEEDTRARASRQSQEIRSIEVELKHVDSLPNKPLVQAEKFAACLPRIQEMVEAARRNPLSPALSDRLGQVIARALTFNDQWMAANKTLTFNRQSNGREFSRHLDIIDRNIGMLKRQR